MPRTKFYLDCQSLGYPIVLGAGVGLGHSESPAIQKLGLAFFDYALTAKARREALAQAMASNTATPAPTLPPAAWAPEFFKAPYVGDYLNHIVYPAALADKVPVQQRVDIPTLEIARLWGDVMQPSTK